jgi:signal peptidase II
MPVLLMGFGGVLFIIDRLLRDGVFLQEKICNTGIAFGIPVFHWALFIIISASLIGIAYWIIRCIQREDFLLVIALVNVFFGALSNIIDRVIYGCVIDYIHIIPYFPWFNIADAMIFFGIVFTGVTYIRKKSILNK